MRLKSKDLIFGIEAKKLRDVFRKCPWGNMDIEFFREELKLTKKASKQILDQMLKQGYLGKKKNEDGYLELLTKANAIRNTKFIKPITREIAVKYVDELIEKSKQMNADDYYIMCVDEIYAFGSYITDSIDCQDIDLAVILKKKRDLSFDETVKINYSRAPYGRTIVEQASWATDIEPMKFLKGKNRYYSFHEKKDAENASDGNLKLIWKK